MKCRNVILPLTIVAMSGATMFASDNPEKRITESATVLNEIMATKDRGIPEDLLEKAQCVGIVPDLKRAGLIIGAKYGKGVVVCRTPNRPTDRSRGNGRRFHRDESARHGQADER